MSLRKQTQTLTLRGMAMDGLVYCPDACAQMISTFLCLFAYDQLHLDRNEWVDVLNPLFSIQVKTIARTCLVFVPQQGVLFPRQKACTRLIKTRGAFNVLPVSTRPTNCPAWSFSPSFSPPTSTSSSPSSPSSSSSPPPSRPITDRAFCCADVTAAFFLSRAVLRSYVVYAVCCKAAARLSFMVSSQWLELYALVINDDLKTLMPMPVPVSL